MFPAGCRAKVRFRLPGGGSIAGNPAQVHQIDHRRGRTVPADDVEHGGHSPQVLLAATKCMRNIQPEQSALGERGDRFLWKYAFAIDTSRVGAYMSSGNCRRFGHHALLVGIQPVHLNLRSRSKNQFR
jgi:hypothetical protein